MENPIITLDVTPDDPKGAEDQSRRFFSESEIKAFRTYRRFQSYDGDGFKANLHFYPNKNIDDLRVLDISSRGVAIGLPQSEWNQNFQPKKNIYLELSLGADKSIKVFSKVIAVSRESADQLRLALNFLDQTSLFAPDMAQHSLESYAPLLGKLVTITPEPHETLVRVIAMKKNCLRMEIFNKNIILIPRTDAGFKFLLDTAQTDNMEISIYKTHVHSGKLIVEAEFNQMPKEVERRLAVHLFNHLQMCPEHIRSMGLSLCLRRIQPQITFSYVRTEEQYKQVLKLRRDSYEASGKIDRNTPVGDMQCEIDGRSRILVAYHGRVMIASVSITFPNNDGTPLDTESALSHGYPMDLGNRDQMVEISRLCFDNRYKGIGLFKQMVAEVFKIIMLSDRRIVVTSTDDRLLKLYKKIGFKQMGATYRHPSLKGVEHHVIYTRIHKAFTGLGVNYFIWHSFFREVGTQVQNQIEVNLNLFKRLNLAFYRFCSALKVKWNRKD